MVLLFTFVGGLLGERMADKIGGFIGSVAGVIVGFSIAHLAFPGYYYTLP